MKKFFFKIIILLNTFCCFNFIFAENILKIDTIVNDDIITNYDISERINLLKLIQNKEINIFKVRDDLINEELIKQYSEKINLTINNNEYRTFEKDTVFSLGVNEENFKLILNKNKINYESFEKFLKAKILWNKLIKNKFMIETKLTTNDINKPLFKNIFKKEINLSEIVIPFKERGKDNSIKLANRLYSEINNSEKFELAVKRFSRSQTSQNKGEIGSIEIKKLPNKVQEEIKNLKSKKITKPIIFDDKVIILKINETNKNKIKKIDYEVKYFFSKDIPQNYQKSCDKNYNKSIISIKLSQTNRKLQKILKQINNYQTIEFKNNNESYLTLCNREIFLKEEEVVEFKNKIFNEKIMIKANKFLNELYRTSNIKTNE